MADLAQLLADLKAERRDILPYPEQVDFVVELMGKPPLKGNANLVADASGVGRPVADLFRKAGLPPQGVSITGGGDPDGGQALRAPGRQEAADQ
jgi:hypothetical protein